MASDNRKIAKNTGLLYIRQLLTLALSLYASSLTLQVLGETDFGIYATVAGFTALLATITNSLATGTQRFIIFELGRGDISKLNKIYCTAVNVHIILSVILIIFGEIVGSWFIFNEMTVPDDRLMTSFWVFQVTILNSVISILNTPNNAEIIAHEDMGTWAFIAILDVLLKCAFVALLFIISTDKLLTYAFFIFFIQLLNVSLCVVWCNRKYKEVKYRIIWDKSLLKSMMTVTGWLGLNNLAVMGFIQGVNLLLNVFFGPVLNAAYTIAIQAYSGIRQFCSSFQLASTPQIVKLYSMGELEEMKKLIFSVSRISFYLIFILSFPFVINANFILTLWLNNVPEHTESFFILLLLFAYTDVLAYPLDTAAQATGKLKKYSICVSVVVLSTLIFSYVAFAMGSIPETIYIIAIIISWISLIIRLYCLNSIIGIEIKRYISEVFSRIILVAFFSTILPLALYYILTPSILKVLLLFVVSIINISTCIYLVGLTKGEKEFLLSVVFKFKNVFCGK